MARHGQKVQRLPEAESREVDASRGTALWGFNFLRMRVLTSLLNDLIDFENAGFDEEEYCKAIRRMLDHLANAATEVPSGGFLTGSLYEEIDSFAKTYANWNGVNGKSPEAAEQRRKEINKLKKQRQKISDKARRLQFELSNDLDQKLVAETYSALGDLITLVPDAFRNLSRSYRDFQLRGGLA